MNLSVGIDMGSTTVKFIVLNEKNEILYQSYERHMSKAREVVLEKIHSLKSLLEGHTIHVAMSGSSGLSFSSQCELPFIQEVFACGEAVKHFEPSCDIVIELGGEDAKVLFLKDAMEERMNSTCAGGTGAFIDQMASLLNLDLAEFDELSLSATTLYPIASRCGVFAKSDLQPLINQGAMKSNLAASIFQSVVDQTITGLAQGRKLAGKILFLGGPLTFMKGLRKRFTTTLQLDSEHALFPENGLYFVALGAARFAFKEATYSYSQLHSKLLKATSLNIARSGCAPLFGDEAEYQAFVKRHDASQVPYVDLATYQGNAYLGIDAGSTTTKLVLIDENDHLLYSYYASNLGNPIEVVKQQLIHIYQTAPERFQIKGSCVCGYGEELIKSAFHVDEGIVETMAHYRAAMAFNPEVDFILDIGGQDMKCFRIKDHNIDDLILNEACSSGCGSFLESFASSLGYSIEDFSALGLLAKNPVDLGSRCTVFMNSSVKEAQKNGASISDISAGLAISVVKNALYKVIRIRNRSDLGENIVVQGGTFTNDSVLAAFEKECGHNVIRPKIAGLMGAYGAALHIKNKKNQHATTLLDYQSVLNFTHESESKMCVYCVNHCNLTVNRFQNGESHIAGNKCERPLREGKIQPSDIPNLYQYKFNKLLSYQNTTGERGVIGIPFVLNMYENIPFWQPFFKALGFQVVLSGRSSKRLYSKGQQTIPSDTICYPAKLVHGHIQTILNHHVDYLFYPCSSYNFDEKISENTYNCPVVAYYPEVIESNMELNNIPFLSFYINLNDPKFFESKIIDLLKENKLNFTKQEIHEACQVAFDFYHDFKADLLKEGQKALNYAQEHQLKSIILCGRPYHADPEINHGLPALLNDLGFVVISEDAIPYEPYDVHILNQWTYHARMFNAAYYAGKHDNIEIIQLVSFGCGIDAITTDEMRDILRSYNKLYTGIKIDEVDNLGAIKIRVRSLLAAIDERGGVNEPK